MKTIVLLCLYVTVATRVTSDGLEIENNLSLEGVAELENQ